MNTLPRDDRENVGELKDKPEIVFRVGRGGVTALSNNGWFIDENDNVWAPGEVPSLVLDNGQTPANEPQMRYHQALGDLLNGDK